MRRRRALAFLAAASGALLAGIGTYIKTKGGEQPRQPSSSSALREAELIDPSGAPVSLPFGDKRFLINFWGTWCPPCIHEMPLLDEAASTAKVPVYGLAVDEPERVSEFLAQMPVSYPIAIAGLDGGIKLARASGNETSAMPFTVIIEADGSLGEVYFGSFSSSKEIIEFFTA